MSASMNIKHIGKVLLAFAVGLFFLILYLDAAQKQNRHNHSLIKSDQGTYRIIAKEAYETRFQYTGNRNQMPLYPWIQALFYSPEMDDETFFQQGKRLNVVLSLLGLLALGIAFFAKFSKLYAFYSILVIAFLVFAIKSPWFQAEILFYTLLGFVFILSLDTILSPKWYKSIGIGVLFALAHLTKASGMPALFIFISSYGILFLLKLFSRSLNREQIKQILVHALTPLAVFMILLFPYFQESNDKYGTYFYNVNTTFYMWYDSWREAREGTWGAGDHVGWPNLPDEEIPSLSKYLEEHSAAEIIDRFRDGADRLLRNRCNNNKHGFGYCSQVGLSLIILALGLPLLFKGIRQRKGEQNMHIVLYVLLFFLLYTLAFLWYQPIIGRGHRNILSLAIPLLWTIGLVVHSPQIQSLQFKLFQRRVKVFHIVYLLMLLTLFYEIYQVIAFRAATMHGGN